jgi:putative tryptophan/tyrosine transport system substrate-binding protein
LAYHDEFQRGLRELGYVEGRNIVIEYRFADGKFDRLGALAAELVQLNVDVIVSVVTQASLAAKNATGTIPIIIVSVGDPVGAGLVASLARPGANVTGNSAMTIEVIGKSLGLFKQTVPEVSPMAVLWNPNNVYLPRPNIARDGGEGPDIGYSTPNVRGARSRGLRQHVRGDHPRERSLAAGVG